MLLSNKPVKSVNRKDSPMPKLIKASDSAPREVIPPQRKARPLIDELVAINILRAMRDHLPPTNHARFLAEKIDITDGNGDCWDTPMDVDGIMEAYNSMPEADRNKILNGWHVTSLETRREDLGECLTAEDWYPAVMVECSRLDDRVSPAVSVTATVMMGDAYYHPVQVIIKAGITKKEAMAELRDAVEIVDSLWDEIIARNHASDASK